MTNTICLDLDGVFCDFTRAYGDLLIKVGGDLLPEGWRDDPTFPRTWFWERDAGYSAEIEKEVWHSHILQKGSTFWQTLEPLPDARETLMMLNARQKRGDAVWFVSHRMGYRAHQQTLDWLYENGIDYPCLFFAADKIPYLRLLDATFFIDDRIETLNELMRVATEECWVLDKKWYFLKSAPYNQDGRRLDLKVATSAKDALVKAGLWS